MTDRSSLRVILDAAGTLSCSADVEVTSFDEQWDEFRMNALVLEYTDNGELVYLFGGDMVAVGDHGLYQEYVRYFGAQDGFDTTRGALSVDSNDGIDVLLDEQYSDSSGGRIDLS
ncbi:MAG: hypothetical protein AAF449_08180 [Myxococcota bacterium]